MGLRLEKHLEKLREQYKAQKEEEETKRQFYHREGVDGNESSDGQPDESMEISTHSEQTSEHSPAPQERDVVQDVPDVSHSTQEIPPPVAALGHRVLPESSPKHKPTPPEPAPKPKVLPQTAPRPPVRGVPLVNNGRMNESTPPVSSSYNPYPPPTQAAPPSPKDVGKHSNPQQPPLLPQAVAPPTSPQQHNPDKEALFAFAWYHGSIPRDEALHRLEGVGGYDG